MERKRKRKRKRSSSDVGVERVPKRRRISMGKKKKKKKKKKKQASLFNFGFRGGAHKVVVKNDMFFDIFNPPPGVKMDLIYADPPWRYTSHNVGGNISKKFQGQADARYPTQTQEWIESLPIADIAADNAALLMWTTYTHQDEAKAVMRAWGFTPVNTFQIWRKTNKHNALPTNKGLGSFSIGVAEEVVYGERGQLSHLVEGGRGEPVRYIPSMFLMGDKIIISDTEFLLLGKKGQLVKFLVNKNRRNVPRNFDDVTKPNLCGRDLDELEAGFTEKIEARNAAVEVLTIPQMERFTEQMQTAIAEGAIPVEVQKQDVFSSIMMAARGRHSAKPAIMRARIEQVFSRARNKLELFARKPVEGWYTWGNDELVVPTAPTLPPPPPPSPPPVLSE